MKYALPAIHRQLLHRGRPDTSWLEIAGRAHPAAQFLLVHVQRPVYVVQVIEQFEVLAFRNPGDPAAYALVQKYASWRWYFEKSSQPRQ